MKILVSDYDKTFEVNEESVEVNKEAVRRFREKGNIFIIATGRSYLDIMHKLQKYNILCDYLIINHGATILDKNNNILYNFTIDRNIITSLINDLEINKYNIKYLDYKPEKMKEKLYFCCSGLKSRVDFNSEDLTKIAVTYDDNIDVADINNKIKIKYPLVNSYHISKKSIEIITKEINKSKAIKILIDKYNFDINLIFTIGDGYSDFEMIKDYNGYAMKNSVEKMKKVAIKEVESVQELIDLIM